MNNNSENNALEYLLSAQIRLNYKISQLPFGQLEKDTPSIMGRNLKRIRSLLKWSQREMASALNVSLSQYKKYESGAEIMRMVTAAGWTVLLGIPFHQLFYGSQFPLDWDRLGISDELTQLLPELNRLDEKDFVNWLSLAQGVLNSHIHYDSSTNQNASRQKALDDLTHYYADIAKGLTCFRQLVHMTQESMSEILNVSLSTYQGYENNADEHSFSVIMAVRFFLATRINPIWLMAGTHFFQYRQLQNQRLVALKQLMQNCTPRQFGHLLALAKTTVSLVECEN